MTRPSALGAGGMVLIHGLAAIGLLALTTPTPAPRAPDTVMIELLPVEPVPAPAPQPAPAPLPMAAKPQAKTVAPKTPAAPPPPALIHTASASNHDSPIQAADNTDKTPPNPLPSEPAHSEAAPAPSPVEAPTQAPRFDADYLSNPAPAYPRISRDLGEEGRVLLRVQVDEQGRATQVLVDTSSGFPRLDRAAREAVARWKFVPAHQGKQAVAGWVKVPIVFELKLN